MGDLMERYDRRCAYLALYLEETSTPTVDHLLPKSLVWDRVYEWSNYRLCAGIVNARKGDRVGIVDPIQAKHGWFELDLLGGRVLRGAGAPRTQHRRIDATLPLLNARDCCRQRQRYIEEYGRGPGARGIDLSYLEYRAPFIARELRRQGRLVRGDV